MSRPLKLLLVEDSADDAALLLRELKKGGYDPAHRRVDTAEAMTLALQEEWDLVIADYVMPEFSGLEALKVLQASGRDCPFIILSGGIGEDIAVDAMRAGAHDYIMKGNMARLLPAIERELAEARIRAEHRKAEEARRATERQYREVVDNAREGIAVVQDDRFKFVNPFMTSITGFSEKQLMEKTAAEFVHAEDRSDFQKRVYVDSVLGDTVLQHTFRLVREDGGVRWLRNNGVVIDWEGRPATLNFLEDITARKEMEDALVESREQFRLFMKYIPGFAIIKDDVGHSLYVNERVADFFGRPTEEILGKTDFELWPGNVEVSAWRKDDLTVIKTGKVIERVEVLEAKNRTVALLTYKFPIFKKDGQTLVGIMAIDITERKETEDELKTTKEQLEIEREALEKKNVALGEILQRIETEKDALKHQFATNVEEAILPTLMRLKEAAGETMRRNFELIEHELRDIASPFLTEMKGKFTRLSPRELEVCRLIKNGMTTKEIAEVLNLSPMTVQKHREIIRKKLGLVNNQTNLNTYLQSMK